jgi:hypothetical protein
MSSGSGGADRNEISVVVVVIQDKPGRYSKQRRKAKQERQRADAC